MSDEQERRISECERRIERLYGVTQTAGERIAVMESKMENIAQSIQDSQKATNDRIQAMNADVKSSSELAHRRTVMILTFGLGGLTALVQIAGFVLQG